MMTSKRQDLHVLVLQEQQHRGWPSVSIQWIPWIRTAQDEYNHYRQRTAGGYRVQAALYHCKRNPDTGTTDFKMLEATTPAWGRRAKLHLLGNGDEWLWSEGEPPIPDEPDLDGIPSPPVYKVCRWHRNDEGPCNITEGTDIDFDAMFKLAAELMERYSLQDNEVYLFRMRSTSNQPVPQDSEQWDEAVALGLLLEEKLLQNGEPCKPCSSCSQWVVPDVRGMCRRCASAYAVY